VGNPPIFKGRWAPDPVCDCTTGQVIARSATQVLQWDAKTIVNGTTNSDVTPDVGYTVEMRFNLDSLGYHLSTPGGDIVEWNLSIYDTDNWWKSPLGFDLSRNRAWWACPWGNVAEQDEVRIYADPTVTTASGALPALQPDFRIPTTGNGAPTIDGLLNDPVWAVAPSFDLRWNDNTLRNSYASVGKWRSGSSSRGCRSTIPIRLRCRRLGTVATPPWYFWKGDFLYLGFDVRDIRVESNALEDSWDGFTVSITNRTEVDAVDHNLAGKGLSFHVGPTGTPGNVVPAKDLIPLVNAQQAQVAIALKPGTTVDSTGTTADDTGYTAELRVDLKGLGYPPGLGDHTMFFGVDLHDDDRYSNPASDSYATRTWFYREREEQCCPAWTLLDGTYVVGSVTDTELTLRPRPIRGAREQPQPIPQQHQPRFRAGPSRERDVAGLRHEWPLGPASSARPIPGRSPAGFGELVGRAVGIVFVPSRGARSDDRRLDGESARQNDASPVKVVSSEAARAGRARPAPFVSRAASPVSCGAP
jgi:hypothetical protein